MRLDAVERNALNKALAGINAEQVFLFGSRVDDAKKGGDIDIPSFLKTPRSSFPTKSQCGFLWNAKQKSMSL